MTAAQFTQQLRLRRMKGEALASIGRSLAVHHSSVDHWLRGTRNPDRRTLLLAELLWGGPTDLADGLAGDKPPGPR